MLNSSANAKRQAGHLMSEWNCRMAVSVVSVRVVMVVHVVMSTKTFYYIECASYCLLLLIFLSAYISKFASTFTS